MRNPLPTVMVLIVSVAALSACGPSAEEKKEAEDRTVAAAAKKAEEAKQKEIGETGALCKSMLDELNSELGEMNSRISVGLKPDDYSQQVGDIRVAYDRTEFDSSPNIYCLQKVGVPLESAMNEYAQAGSDWSDCIQDFSCDVDEDALPGMQKRWLKAGKLIDKSDAALADFQLD